MIEVISSSIAAGETKTFHINGEYFEILAAQYPVDAMMLGREGQQLSIMRNAEASYYSKPGAFASLQISSATAQTVRFFVGSGDAGTRRLSGVVEVVDGGKSRTLANQAFIAAGVVGVNASQYGGLQLWNPAGSGKRLILKSSRVSLGSVSGSYNLQWCVSAMSIARTSGIVPKVSGGPIGAARVYQETSLGAAYVGGTTYDSIVTGFLAANISDAVAFAEPVVITPGSGVAWSSVVPGAYYMSVGAEFTEEAI